MAAEPGAGTGALASLTDGDGPAAATDAPADASPTGTGPAKKKKGRKQKGRVPALQAEPADDPQSSAVPATKPKKKGKASKAMSSKIVPSLDAAATPGLVEAQADQLKQVTKTATKHGKPLVLVAEGSVLRQMVQSNLITQLAVSMRVPFPLPLLACTMCLLSLVPRRACSLDPEGGQLIVIPL